MPRLKLTKRAIDALPTPAKDVVYWDSGCPGFGVKITPKGRKVFIVFYRCGGTGSRLRKYTIGPYGRVTLHQARGAARLPNGPFQRVPSARLDRLRRSPRSAEVSRPHHRAHDQLLKDHPETNFAAIDRGRKF